MSYVEPVVDTGTIDPIFYERYILVLQTALFKWRVHELLKIEHLSFYMYVFVYFELCALRYIFISSIVQIVIFGCSQNNGRLLNHTFIQEFEQSNSTRNSTFIQWYKNMNRRLSLREAMVLH